jgi:phosphatidylglycerol:prolipoprotein diacylglycerol transferase
MSFHGGFLGVLSRCGSSRAGVGKRGSTSPISSRRSCPLGLAAAGSAISSTASSSAGRPTCRGRWCFPQVDNLRGTRPQLYEFGLEGLLLFAILWIVSRRGRGRAARYRLFLIGYGVFRFLAEFAREPDSFPRLSSRAD